MASKYSTCSILVGRRFATDFKCIATQAWNRVWGLMYKKVLLPKVDTVFSHVNVNKHASNCLSHTQLDIIQDVLTLRFKFEKAHFEFLIISIFH